MGDIDDHAGDGAGDVDDVGTGGRRTDEIVWLSTKEAARRLGVTTRTLYRFIDDGGLAAYRLGRVIRLKQADIDDYIERCRIEPGTLEHLYPESSPGGAVGESSIA
jgi:excisionase family DNA binding protein